MRGWKEQNVRQACVPNLWTCLKDSLLAGSQIRAVGLLETTFLTSVDGEKLHEIYSSCEGGLLVRLFYIWLPGISRLRVSMYPQYHAIVTTRKAVHPAYL